MSAVTVSGMDSGGSIALETFEYGVSKWLQNRNDYFFTLIPDELLGGIKTTSMASTTYTNVSFTLQKECEVYAYFPQWMSSGTTTPLEAVLDDMSFDPIDTTMILGMASSYNTNFSYSHRFHVRKRMFSKGTYVFPSLGKSIHNPNAFITLVFLEVPFTPVSETSVGANVVANSWNYVSFTYNRTTTSLDMYVNDSKISTFTGVELNTETNHNEFYIGMNPQVGTNFVGEVDDIVVYNRALEPAQLYAKYEPVIDTIMLQNKVAGHWTFNDLKVVLDEFVDNSVVNSKMTVVGNVTIGENQTVANRSLKFDGTPTTYVEAVNASLDASVLTVGTWVKPETNTAQTFVEKQGVFQMGMTEHGVPVMTISDAPTSNSALTTKTEHPAILTDLTFQNEVANASEGTVVVSSNNITYAQSFNPNIRLNKLAGSFNGVDSEVLLGPVLNSVTNKLTMSAWVNLASLQAGQTCPILCSQGAFEWNVSKSSEGVLSTDVSFADFPMINDVYNVPGTYTWVSPGNGKITIELQGGDGGDYQSNRTGGNGGYLCVDVDVIGGVEYTIVIGGPGEKNTNSSNGSKSRHGGGGGGGTGFKASTETWMVIAGGGGGAADTGNGGAGGIPDVFNGTNGSGSGNGKKGTTTAGGAAGSGRKSGVAGIQYVGGRAGTEKTSDILGGEGIGNGGNGGIGGNDYAGGGGGGGWYGGGGGGINGSGHGGGGGGGSSYYDTTNPNVQLTSEQTSTQTPCTYIFDWQITNGDTLVNLIQLNCFDASGVDVAYSLEVFVTGITPGTDYWLSYKPEHISTLNVSPTRLFSITTESKVETMQFQWYRERYAPYVWIYQDDAGGQNLVGTLASGRANQDATFTNSVTLGGAGSVKIVPLIPPPPPPPNDIADDSVVGRGLAANTQIHSLVYREGLYWPDGSFENARSGYDNVQPNEIVLKTPHPLANVTGDLKQVIHLSNFILALDTNNKMYVYGLRVQQLVQYQFLVDSGATELPSDWYAWQGAMYREAAALNTHLANMYPGKTIKELHALGGLGGDQMVGVLIEYDDRTIHIVGLASLVQSRTYYSPDPSVITVTGLGVGWVLHNTIALGGSGLVFMKRVGSSAPYKAFIDDFQQYDKDDASDGNNVRIFGFNVNQAARNTAEGLASITTTDGYTNQYMGALKASIASANWANQTSSGDVSALSRDSKEPLRLYWAVHHLKELLALGYLPTKTIPLRWSALVLFENSGGDKEWHTINFGPDRVSDTWHVKLKRTAQYLTHGGKINGDYQTDKFYTLGFPGIRSAMLTHDMFVRLQAVMAAAESLGTGMDDLVFADSMRCSRSDGATSNSTVLQVYVNSTKKAYQLGIGSNLDGIDRVMDVNWMEITPALLDADAYDYMDLKNGPSSSIYGDNSRIHSWLFANGAFENTKLLQFSTSANGVVMLTEPEPPFVTVTGIDTTTLAVGTTWVHNEGTYTYTTVPTRFDGAITPIYYKDASYDNVTVNFNAPTEVLAWQTTWNLSNTVENDLLALGFTSSSDYIQMANYITTHSTDEFTTYSRTYNEGDSVTFSTLGRHASGNAAFTFLAFRELPVVVPQIVLKVGGPGYEASGIHWDQIILYASDGITEIEYDVNVNSALNPGGDPDVLEPSYPNNPIHYAGRHLATGDASTSRGTISFHRSTPLGSTLMTLFPKSQVASMQLTPYKTDGTRRVDLEITYNDAIYNTPSTQLTTTF